MRTLARASKGRRWAIGVVVALVAAAGCGGTDDAGSTVDPEPEQVEAADCLVLLHGKGGEGRVATLDGDRAIVQPDGTESGWGGLQWIYAEPGPFGDGLASIGAEVEAARCERIVVHGFSNGASMAAKMYCAGETLDGRAIGYIVDDPVVDASSAGCLPADGVDVALYWTGALAEAAPPGTTCAAIDWTCEGPTVGDIATYAAELGTEAMASVTDEHERHPDPPEVGEWLS